MSGEDKKEPDAKGSGSGKPGEADSAASPWTGLLKETAKTLMPVLLSGASLIGFVAFAGAVIVWTRFDAIGVPPDQAVRAVPRSELVSTGSSLLLLFGFFGVLAVLATYLVDRGGRATPGMSRVLLLVVALEGIIAVVLADGAATLAKVAAMLGLLVLVGLALIATFDQRFAVYEDLLAVREGETEEPRRGPDSLHDSNGRPRLSGWVPTLLLLFAAGLAALAAVLVFSGPGGWWSVATWSGIAALLIAFLALSVWAWAAIEESRRLERERGELEEEAYREDRRREEAGLIAFVKRRYADVEKHLHPEPVAATAAAHEAKRLARRRPHRLVLRFWGACGLTVLGAAAIAASWAVVGQWWLAVSLGAAFILAAGVWRVAVLSNTNFMWYGLAVFISVPLFGTCALMARNVAEPQVQPMALIRSTDGPDESIQGIYVTEGSDRVYFASVATEGCNEEVTPDSGRLQWVPKSEVVAMSVGPLQQIDKAGKAALEMANALTPSIETPNGEQVSLPTAAPEPGAEEEEEEGEGESGGVAAPEGDESGAEAQASEGDEEAAGESGEEAEGEESEGEKAEDEKAEAEAKEKEAAEAEEAETVPLDRRLAGAGPAIRPNFGSGLKLVPAEAEPGDVVELRMSAPNEDNGVDGFGETPEGFDLRLNGVRLAVLRVPVREPARAEYVKTVGGRVLPIVDYFKVTEEDSEGNESTTGFVRLDRNLVHSVTDAEGERGNFTLELAPHGKLAPLPAENGAAEGEPPTVTLPNGEEEQLQNVLLRRSWSPTRIKFRVPDNAATGEVSVECGQLAGQPVLDVVHPPVARIAVRVHPGTERLTFDSRQSADEGEATPKRVWRVGGRRLSGKEVVSTELPPRLAPYEVSLTISDVRSGLSDRVDLSVWRLPSSSFLGARAKRAARREYERRVRDSLEEETRERQPVAIELDGHADLRQANVGHSLAAAARLRKLLFAPHEAKRGESTEVTGGTEVAGQTAKKSKAPDEKPLLNGGASIPMLLRAFGESCPIVRHPGPQPVNNRVEVFLLGSGATVGTGSHCHTARSGRVYW